MSMSAPRLQELFKWLFLGPLLILTVFLFINAVNLHLPYSYGVGGMIDDDGSLDVYGPSSSANGSSPENDKRWRKTLAEKSDTIKNPHPFRYIISETEICHKRYAEPFLLIVVHSAPHHFKARQFIRESWGRQRQIYDEFKSVIVFMIGQPNGTIVQKNIDEEHLRYRDLVQENYQDSYRNLTYKVVMWLKWTTTYCSNVSFVLKVDDDIVVNMVNVYKFLRYRQKLNDKSTIYCMIWSNLTVHRGKESRWHLSKEDYENDVYPDYCSGSGYILTPDLIEPMYEQSFKTKFFWIDDIYITGILAKKLKNVRHHDLSGRYLLSKKYLTDRFMQSYAMFAHLPGQTSLRHWFWEEMKKAKPYYQTQNKYTSFGDAAIKV